MDVVAHCLKQPGAEETYPFGPEVTVFKVRGKMFALLAPPANPVTISLKCDPIRAIVLRQDHSEVTPGYHLNKVHWNTIDLTGTLDFTLVRSLIDHSYGLVAH